MKPIVVEKTIHASKEAVFQFISNIEEASQHISGIEKVEPVKGICGEVGFTWNETRVMFGKEDTVQLKITELEPNQHYKVGSTAHGVEYESVLKVEDIDVGCKLSMSFFGQPKTTMSKMMMFLMGWLAVGSTKKVLNQDLDDIKSAVEGRRN